MDKTLSHLRCLNARFIHNYVTNDVASHDALLHPRFTYISGHGERIDRGTYLKNWATGFSAETIPYWDTRDERIVIEGNLALVSAMNKYVERLEGRAQTAMAAYTDTYVCDDGQWRCIQAQITMVAPVHWPPDDTIISVYVDGRRLPGVKHGG